MKTYTNASSQGYRQSNKQSFLNNDEEGDSVMTIIFVGVMCGLMIILMCGMFLLVFNEAMSVMNTPVKSAVVTNLGETTIQLKYSNGEQRRFFLNDATKLPEKGQKVKVKRVMAFDNSAQFHVVGYDNEISTRHHTGSD